MGKLNVEVDDKVYQSFRDMAFKVYGKSEEGFDRAVGEAITNWIKRIEEKHEKKALQRK